MPPIVILDQFKGPSVPVNPTSKEGVDVSVSMHFYMGE